MNPAAVLDARDDAVQDHGPGRPTCEATRANLAAYIRAGLSDREATRVSAHLECCRPCTATYLAALRVPIRGTSVGSPRPCR